jgi:hypothetical protein
MNYDYSPRNYREQVVGFSGCGKMRAGVKECALIQSKNAEVVNNSVSKEKKSAQP